MSAVMLASGSVPVLAGQPAINQRVVTADASDRGLSDGTGSMKALPSAEALSLDAQIAKLNDETLAVRERASLELSNDSRLTSRVVEEYLSKPGISAEQRVRLGVIGEARFRTEPRAAMGVSFDQGRFLEGVTIRGAIEGFDSARVLQPGDMILSLDGEQVRNDNQARVAILSKEPGENVELRIVRRGETMTVHVKLGRLDNLRDGPRIDPTLQRRLWGYRTERALKKAGGGEAAGVIDPGVSEKRWEAISQVLEQANEAQESAQNAQNAEAGPGLAAGGSMRDPKAEAMIRFSSNAPSAPAQDIATLQAQLASLEDRIRGMQVQWMNPNLRAEDRAKIQNAMELLRRRHIEIQEKIQKHGNVIER
jgi:hypothetical protein